MKKTADQGWGGDTHPGEEPDAVGNAEQASNAMQMDLRRDYSQLAVPDPPVYQAWVFINGHVTADADRTVEELIEDHGYNDRDKAMAYGYVAVQHRWTANFQILHSNIGLTTVISALKKFAKAHKWQFNAVVDHNAQEFAMNQKVAGLTLKPIDQERDEFGVYDTNDFPVPIDEPYFKGTMQECREWIREKGHRVAADPGSGNQTVDKAWVNSDEFANDIQPGHFRPDPSHDWTPDGLYEWGGLVFDTYDELRRAMMQEAAPDTKEKPPFNPIDGDKMMPADWNNSTTPDWVALMSHVKHEARGAAPKVVLPGPIPFIYDIDQDRVYVGFPGETTEDVKAGDYNPLGIVEGDYKPNGEVEIRTRTNMPYTIRHMIQLWYYMHPELAVKTVIIEYPDGTTQKLASFSQRHSMAEPPEGYEDFYRRIPNEEWPERFYHVAPREHRDDILQNGLNATGRTHNHGFDPAGWNPETGANFKEDENGDLLEHEWRPEGIYMFDALDRASDYASRGRHDIWEVNPHPHSEILADPSQAMDWGYYGDEGERAYFTDSVPAESLRLHTPGSGQSDWQKDVQAHRFPKTSATQTLWRGLNLGLHTMDEVTQYNADPLAVINQAMVGYPNLGIHWTDDPTSAENFALARDPEGWAHENDDWEEGQVEVGIILETEVDSQYVLEPGTEEHEGYQMTNAILDYGTEREITVRDGAPITISSAWLVWDGDQGGMSQEIKMGTQHTAAGSTVPPAPGTTPVPPNHVRLYHYTNSPESFERIKREGIKNSEAVGNSYMEPNQIWASAQMPDSRGKLFFEFSMPTDDPRLDIGKFQPGIHDADGTPYTPETWARMKEAAKQDFTIPYGDISPEEIIGAHEPWHATYRYIKDNYASDPEWYDQVLGRTGMFQNNDEQTQKAIDAYNRDFPPKTSKVAAAPDNVGDRVRELLKEDPAAVEVYNALSPLGNVYVVGGAIRDLALGRTPKDIDIMAQGISPEDCMKALKLRPGRVEVTGNQFPVIRYFHPSGYQCEVALPRREESTGGGSRKDFNVQMDVNMPVEEDLERRDFTGNSMAVDLKTGQLVDPYGGWRDLEEGKLKLVHPNAFSDDATRILRALSSRSRHGLVPDADTEAAMAKWADRIDTHVVNEMKSAELEKLLSGDDPASAIELAQRTGVLKHLLPELDQTVGFDQKNRYHGQLLFDHIMTVLRKVAEINGDPDVRLAAMLHDIGKPESQWIDDKGFGHFYERHDTLDSGEEIVRGKDHDKHGADLAANRLRQLTYGDSNRQQRVQHLIRHHMFPPFDNEKGARKFINRVETPQHAMDLLDIREADAGAKREEWDGDTDQMRDLVNVVQETGQATDLSGLALNGNDVIQILGIKPGIEVGEHLQRLQEIVLEDPAMNNRETLTEALRMKTANILDPVQDTLDHDVFDNADKAKPKVKPHIVEWVRMQVENLLKSNDYGDLIPKMRLILTGSLTSYQWAAKSDFDVSLWLDYETFPNIIRADLISLMIEHLDDVLVPGTTHVLQCYVVPDDVQIELLYQPGLRSAYDLDRNKWLVAPEKDRVYNPYAQVPALMGWVHDMAEKLKLMKAYDSYGYHELLHQWHKKRMRDQKAGKGDFSESNLLWKYIEHEGLTKE